MAELDRALADLDPVTNIANFWFTGAPLAGSVLKRFTGETLANELTPAKLISTAANLTDLAVANVITITEPTTLIFQAEIVSTVEFVIEATGSLSIQSLGNLGWYKWGGTGALFSGSGTVILGESFDITSTSTGTLFDLTLVPFARVDMCIAIIDGFDDLGMIDEGTFLSDFTFFTNWGIGLKLRNMVLITTKNMAAALGSTSETFIEILNTKIISRTIEPKYLFENSTFSLLGTSCALRFDPDINSDVNVSIVNGKVSVDGGGSNEGRLFNTEGDTGTFTAVNDAAIAATNVDSVVPISGHARFGFAVGPTLFVGQEVVLSTFAVNPNYNGTFIVTAVGTGYFEVSSIEFGSDETGSFLSDSITVTDTGTTLVDGDTLLLDTDAATDYDGGGTVYNQLTNSFQVNMLYSGVTKTGTWDTGGLDQTDPRVVAINQRELPDSEKLAFVVVNGNTVANGAIVTGVYTDLVFGTVGNALVAGPTMERFKLIDEVKGILEYTGTEPFKGLITFDFTVTSTGGLVPFTFIWEIDTGSGFGDLPVVVEGRVNVGSDASSVTKSYPLKIRRGDKIRPQITRNSGVSGITISFATINVL